LAKISEDDHGVKGFKKKLLGGVEQRLGWFEDDPLYGPSSSVDPRSWSSCIVKEGNRKKARQFLIDEVKKCMEVEGTGAEDPERRTSSSSSPEEEESWERAAKRRKMERQEELRERAGQQQDTSVEALVDNYLYSNIQESECLRFWEKQKALLKSKGPAGKAFIMVIKKLLSAPATSTAVERLFSAAGLIMEAKRNRLSPDTLDEMLFVREAFMLGLVNLDW